MTNANSNQLYHLKSGQFWRLSKIIKQFHWILKECLISKAKKLINLFHRLNVLMVAFKESKTVAVWMSPKDTSTVKIFHHTKSHDVDSHVCGGAKVKGVEETVGVEADSINSMGWISSAAPGIWELCKVCMQLVSQAVQHVIFRESQVTGYFVLLTSVLLQLNVNAAFHQHEKRNPLLKTNADEWGIVHRKCQQISCP